MPKVTIWIRKENEQLFSKITNKSNVINKLLQLYFEKHRT